MRVFAVTGITQSGKTTTVEALVSALCQRGYRVGTVKDIHFEAFTIDTPGTNTHRHRQAGAEVVTAWGLKETDILYPQKLPLRELLKHYDHDFVIIEGTPEGPIPRIITAHNTSEIDERLDQRAFAISGRIADKITSYCGLPAISVRQDVNKLVKLIEDRVPQLLPDFPPECCQACGYANCTALLAAILRKEATYQNCVVKNQTEIKLTINGETIDMVPFVQRILFNAVSGVVKELEGYKPNAEITIHISPQ